MTRVKCPQKACQSNKEGICQREELELDQEPYHAPECENMYCPWPETKKKKSKLFSYRFDRLYGSRVG